LDLKKVQSLLPINQNISLAQDERIQKEGKEKECFPVSFWSSNFFKNAAMMHTFACSLLTINL